MFKHDTVLKAETVNALDVKSNGIYIDCTVGGGGHSEAIASKLRNDGLLLAFDQDVDALNAAKERLKIYEKNIIFIHGNFRNLYEEINKRGIRDINGILFDLGVSSPQLDRGERGFSYQQDAPLDMRMNQEQALTAFEVVNHWSYNELVSIFFKYGEEKFSKQIARKIEKERALKPIETTHQLVNLIKEAIPAPARRKGGHPAKRIFQAIRIAVNDELGAFNDALHQAAQMVGMNGRVAVITFHSLEDRLCKKAFKKWSTQKAVPRNLPIIPEDHQPPFQLITKKPITANELELEDNRRARSAKLRVTKKITKWDETFSYEEGWKS